MLARFFPVRSARGSLPAATFDHSAAPSRPNWLSVSPAAGSTATSASSVVAAGRRGPVAERREQRDRGHDQRADERRAPPRVAGEVAHVLGRDRADPVVGQEREHARDQAGPTPRRARLGRRHRRVGARERSLERVRPDPQQDRDQRGHRSRATRSRRALCPRDASATAVPPHANGVSRTRCAMPVNVSCRS